MPRVEYGPSFPPEKKFPLGREYEQDVNVPGSPYFGHLPRASDLPSEGWRDIVDTANPEKIVPKWYFNPPHPELQSLGQVLRGLFGSHGDLREVPTKPQEPGVERR